MEVKHMNIGKAGEFRVMAELLLRGFQPAIPVSDTGIDIILENGLKLQVKSSRLRVCEGGKGKKGQTWSHRKYTFNTKRGHERVPASDRVDFFICWLIDDDRFLILPTELVNRKTLISYTPPARRKQSRTESLELDNYLDSWEMLKQQDEEVKT